MYQSSNFAEILTELKNLSFLAMGYSSPNPPVACIITDLEGRILREGYTQKTGENHAERDAYRNFDKETRHLVFVTLEPCTHFGKTPPCIDLILEYKPDCVYYGLSDTNPLVRKRDGIKECIDNGIQVVQSPEIAEIAKIFLSGFLSRIEFNRPQVIIKSALSKEGFYSDIAKSKLSLSNSFSNQITQMLRAKFDAVIVGPITVYVDYPGLDFRGVEVNEFENLQPNLKTTNNFLEILIGNFYNKDSIQIHSSKITDYQPLRIFVISLKRIPDLGFFKKQSLLNEKLGSKKVLFFILDFDPDNYSHKNLYIKMDEISIESPVIIEDKNTILESMYEKFSSLSLNTILIEGGNFLYKIFSENLKTNDQIYFIRTQKTIEKGILPDIELANKRKIQELKIDNDTWEVYGE
jgi:diaminohydroxyphosphoribosylaminopyrimidine deaminase / 5-amino-6-(5-phosphoribosylamino)uracil reductase